jgi:N-acetylmuramoyl-L-alanine amidase
MIKPLFFNPAKVNRAFLQAQRNEAETQEDSDLCLVENTPETCPISEDENELRQYIRTFNFTRRITHLVVHTTATQQSATIAAILNYWKNTKGWRNPGYHVILPKDGFSVIQDFNLLSNGAKGFNANGIHISYIGGVDSNGRPLDNRTESQKRLIQVFIEEMVRRFPNLKVIGHNEVANKACPCFQVKNEYSKFWTGV